MAMLTEMGRLPMDPLTLKPPFDATDKRMYGLPCFKGTRIPVRDLMTHLGESDAVVEFLQAHPNLTREQIDNTLTIATRELERIAPPAPKRSRRQSPAR